MRKRRGFEIEQEVISLLSERDCIGTTICNEIGINSKMVNKILASLDERGILSKEIKPSNRGNRLCLHYHISSLTEESK